jgi:hypothetical protein
MKLVVEYMVLAGRIDDRTGVAGELTGKPLFGEHLFIPAGYDLHTGEWPDDNGPQEAIDLPGKKAVCLFHALSHWLSLPS